MAVGTVRLAPNVNANIQRSQVQQYMQLSGRYAFLNT
jgi:hypothetical protein